MTVVTSYKIHEHPNVTQLLLPFHIDQYVSNTFSLSNWRELINFFSLCYTWCSEALAMPEVQDINIEEYDLVMTGVYLRECFLSLIDKTEASHKTSLKLINKIALIFPLPMKSKSERIMYYQFTFSF